MPFNNFGNYNNYNQYNAPKKKMIPKAKNQNKVNKNYNSQKKSTTINYMQLSNSNDNNIYYNNTFNGFNFMEEDYTESPMNFKKQQDFKINNNIIKNDNKEKEIQERFDELQNKLNKIQNLIKNASPKYESVIDENNYIFPNQNNNNYGINNNNYYTILIFI